MNAVWNAYTTLAGGSSTLRSFEIALVVGVLMATALCWDPRRFGGREGRGESGWRVYRNLISGLLFLLLCWHVLIEGAHWQMAPVYLSVLLVAGLLWLRPRRGLIPICSVVVLMVAAACGFSYVFPVFQLPRMTGPMRVGTRVLSMRDDSRREDAPGAGGAAREVVVQLWYPTESRVGPRAPYRRKSETSLANSYLSVDWTQARLDAPVAPRSGGFPLLLYSPGWNGRRTQNTALILELASHGYVVAAIDHPYNTGPVTLGDGRIIKPLNTPELGDDVTPAERIYSLIDKEVAKQTQDTEFVLTRLLAWNGSAGSDWFQAIDGGRIGTLGYSLGGAVAAETAFEDSRIRAVLDLDTPLYGKAGRLGIKQPFLLLCHPMDRYTEAELSAMRFGERRNELMDRDDYARQLPLLKGGDSYQFSVAGTLHSSFQDGVFVSPLKRFSGAGEIAPKRVSEILGAYALAFFDQELKGVRSPLLRAEKSPFVEVKILYRADNRP